ncbi:hypothetical protein PENSPDRAFT_666479 [Peniophora sp. CONT]|nr:hypothetical protein PENSPDRAFT_666479 [Peniophora sp. CONT]
MSSPTSSSAFRAPARRIGQYKATTTPLLSSSNRKKSLAYSKKPVASTFQWDGSFMHGTETEPPMELPQNNILRERTKQKHLERAQREREAKVRSGRKSAHYSSAGEDCEMDMDDEGEDDFINDEFYARIVLEAERKRDDSYRMSFQKDVGSSFDPALEDPVEWEQNLRAGTYADGPRPPSEFDEDEADEYAALAEDEAYWEALGNTDTFDDPSPAAFGVNASGSQRADDDMDMDMDMN